MNVALCRQQLQSDAKIKQEAMLIFEHYFSLYQGGYKIDDVCHSFVLSVCLSARSLQK